MSYSGAKATTTPDNRVQRDGDILHVIASRVDDYSQLLGRLRTESRDFR